MQAKDIVAFTKAHPFSNVTYFGRKRCCNEMNLVSAIDNTFKCETCRMRGDHPTGVAPIFPADACAETHLANNHILICLICNEMVFHRIWDKTKSYMHAGQCITRALYNDSRPFVCTRCLKTTWLK